MNWSLMPAEIWRAENEARGGATHGPTTHIAYDIARVLVARVSASLGQRKGSWRTPRNRVIGGRYIAVKLNHGA